jgi:hypothetical protein
VTTDFAPLDLSADDRLPADIELVMGYRGGISPEIFAAALERGLRAFPHLTGKLEGMRIVPSGSGFALETADAAGTMDFRSLEEMPLAGQSEAFIPEGRAGSLFAARLTRFRDLSVLGMRVSHAAVDGTGLALFIMHCTAESRGVAPPPVFHGRRYGFGSNLDGTDEAPHGYREAGGALEADLPAGASPTLFAIPTENVRHHFQSTSPLDARLRLAAWLCAALESHFTEVALWCDPRGLNGIPATYTGNLGCYLHFPNSYDLTKQLKATATRAGFRRIADSHRHIKLAESRGRPLVWAGGALQLNLVPHAVAGTDFGAGLPGYAALLSRNSSGLRISLAPDASRFLIEVCLPDGLGDVLLEKSDEAGLVPSSWCRGGKP